MPSRPETLMERWATHDEINGSWGFISYVDTMNIRLCCGVANEEVAAREDSRTAVFN